MQDPFLLFSTFCQRIHPVPEDVLRAYYEAGSDRQESKRSVLTRTGETERYLYFITEGIQKSYYVHEGNAHIMAFSYAPSFSGIPESFLTQTPSQYMLECITDCSLRRWTFAQHHAMIEEHRAMETLFRKATEHLLLGMVHRHHELMALTIEERFRSFARRSGHLFHLVSQKDLASYLRMDPTNLSKLINSVKV